MLRHEIKESTWMTTTIFGRGKRKSIQEAVSLWMTGSQRVRLIDSCHGALCNPTCPDELTFVDPAVNWGDVTNYAIIGLSLVVTVICVLLKIHFMIYYKVGLSSQKRYLDEAKTHDTAEEVR